MTPAISPLPLSVFRSSSILVLHDQIYQVERSHSHYPALVPLILDCHRPAIKDVFCAPRIPSFHPAWWALAADRLLGRRSIALPNPPHPHYHNPQRPSPKKPHLCGWIRTLVKSGSTVIYGGPAFGTSILQGGRHSSIALESQPVFLLSIYSRGHQKPVWAPNCRESGYSSTPHPLPDVLLDSLLFHSDCKRSVQDHAGSSNECKRRGDRPEEPRKSEYFPAEPKPVR